MSIPTNETKTILVIDDHPSVLIVLKAMLEGSRCNVLLAHDTESALRLAQTNDLAIDLILTDITMPDSSGRDLADRILAVRPGVKVLFMAAFVDSEVVRIKLLERVGGLLPEPFTKGGLVECIREKLAVSLGRSTNAKTMNAGA